MSKYKSDQLKKLDIDRTSVYLPTIKLVFRENETNWLSLTYEQYDKIKDILTKETK